MALDLENFEQRGRYWYRPGQEAPYEPRNCEHCQQPCLVGRQCVKRGGGRFCSVRCAKLGGRSPFAGLAPEHHPQWKGDAAGYTAVHDRVRRQRGRATSCAFGCTGTDWYEWANLTGNYPDPNDYAQMCVPCHRRFDAAIRTMTGERQ